MLARPKALVPMLARPIAHSPMVCNKGYEALVPCFLILMNAYDMKREKIITNCKSLFLAIILVSTLLFGSCSKSGKPHYEAYLFAYFEGSAGDRQHQEQLRFAISKDALHWKALNNNEPVLSSEAISQSGGIRDPHILRAEDGKTFYLVATDMSTARNGWKSNPGIVMLKSKDLIHWEHSSVNLSKDYPEHFAKAYWVWAPQTIYDPAAGKYLVYFTLKLEDDDKLDFYSAYANKDFSGFEAAPTLMFSARHGAIDADIVHKDGTWHMFYKGNTKDEQGKEFENGIKQATAPSLQGPWTEHFEYLDVYHNSRTNVEGSSVFKLNDSDSYILMYDLYSSGRYEFQRSEDLYHFTDKPESFVKDFHPRHGSIIGITRKEAKRLSQQWGDKDAKAQDIAPKLSYTFKQHQVADDDRIIYSWEVTGNPIVRHKYTADAAALVHNDTLFIFTGEDYEGGQRGYNIKNWCVFATTDMKNFWEYKIPLRATDFSWGEKNASWASQVIERNGKFYWYTSSQTTGIGVAVSNRPEGPYKDAIGKPLLTNKDSFGKHHSWRTIDPTVFIDDDGQAWLYWGNGACWLVKLNKDMISYDREYGVKMVDIQGEMEFPFTEAPWIHKKDGVYFLSFAVGFPERIAYATSDKAEGPYTYRGIINEIAGNSNTNHQAILEYKGQWYFIYHNGGIQTDGGSFSRSVCIDLLEFDEDGGYKPVQMTTRGVPVLE